MKSKWLGSLSIRSETFSKVTQMILTLSRSRFGNYESTIFKLREQTDSEIQRLRRKPAIMKLKLSKMFVKRTIFWN